MSTDALFNPFLPEFHQDPYPFYARLRREDPVHQSPMGFWVVTRYNDVVTVLRDPRFGRAGFHAMLAAAQPRAGNPDPLPPSMLFQDPPDHTRLRALVNKAFTPRVVEAMRPHIQDIVDGLLDRVVPTGTMDIIEDLAYPLPVRVICEMLGVPVGDQASIRQWSADLARSLDAIGPQADVEVQERGVQARHALAEYFRTQIPERRRQPRTDLLSALIAAEEQGDRLTERELLAMCVLLFVAGHETTVNLTRQRDAGAPASCGRAPAAASRPGAHPRRSRSACATTAPSSEPRASRALTSSSWPHHPAGDHGRGRDRRRESRSRALSDPDHLDLARQARTGTCRSDSGIHFCCSAPPWPGSKRRSRSAR